MPEHVPLATYRLQFNPSFGFRDAVAILDYLRDLGVSHVYASPILTSRHGSAHGYDVTDPSKINPELGGEQGFAEFQSALQERGMGLLLDIVPNHMAASSENRWWMDVLEYGPESPFGSYFDINWRPPARRMENKLLLPFLDRPFAEVLDAGDLRMSCENGKFAVHHGPQLFPVAPHSYAQILRHHESDGGYAAGTERAAVTEWRGIVAAAESIATDRNIGAQAAAERRTKFEGLHERLRQLLSASTQIRAFLETTLKAINGAPGEVRSLCELERILSSQHYRLAFWQTPSDAINYRRFFSITDLVGLRVEDPTVFQATHQTYTHLATNSLEIAYRIDHIDGLRDPRGYLHRLRELLLKGDTSNPGFVVVEKILSANESLPEDWPVQGTTGYDFLNFANRLMADARHASEILEIYNNWTSSRAKLEDIVYEKKILIMRTLLGVEMRSLGRELVDHAADDRYAREIDPLTLTQALTEISACLPVYRTYIQTLDVPEGAQESLMQAVREARARASHLPSLSFDFVSDVLLLTPREHVRPDQREARLAFVTRWQQFTGSITAKGFEDTALYVYFPLLSLNDVGGDPRIEGNGPLAFHEFIADRRQKWPYSMNATTTHDTKRSEDVRARVAVLSELPREWEAKLAEWSRMNEKYTRYQGGTAIPDRNEEYFFYQTLIGAWPLAKDEWATFVERIQGYMIKAAREAKVHTRWIRANEVHEVGLRAFVADVLDAKHNAKFFASFEEFQEQIAAYGMLNGLGQVLLKIACPGVADFYQGSELWDLRLVDPDNRAPVDFEKRGSLLRRLGETEDCESDGFADSLLRNWRDARVKLHVIARALEARRNNPRLFLAGDYRPLTTVGKNGDGVMAFARTDGADWAIAAIVRCVASVRAPLFETADRRKFWEGTRLTVPGGAPSRWMNVLGSRVSPAISVADGSVSLGDVFAAFPVALLFPVAPGKG